MKIFFLIIGIVILSSCSNETEIVKESSTSYANTIKENVLATAPSVYSNYFTDNSELVGFSASKEHSLAENVLTPVFPDNDTLLKSGKVCFMVTANGVDINNAKNSLKSAQITDGNSLFANLYGKNVVFAFKKEGELKSGSLVEKDTVTMYIPDLVQITSPKIATQAELYPMCYFDGFKLGWIADNSNKNGLVVIVEWNGTVLTEADDSKEYVRNIDVIADDNGEAILNSKLFDNIPDRALTYITLLRGNIAIANIDGETFRVFGESHAVLPMILIRNLKE